MNARDLTRQRRRTFGLALLVCGLFPGTPAIAGYHSTIVTVTAYNSVAGQTDGQPKTGAWNNRLELHDVAVSPDLVKRGLDNGTPVAIEGYQQKFVVRDKTADNLHNTVDIYMGKDVTKARRFGRKQLRIWWHISDD